ncbi:16S rRNA (cytidine(1402)-2'-O)-methyltransferase [Helicobacter canadensis]|uniref:Ribosomal RNA small subunit methyltransferase I n=1 Tax=Helicobacter canadensis MIT 98-5491 TaxID=537970 RepID=C5ZWF9_9HELI|nr:16S rRNA (cytidine(1402)-2'-O)-methyltransferase [Helicobacter canadensis]EES89477.1 putative methylase [Helicobacter canadensis MIT 98-5491]EFR48268.1 S-adenosylmethionine-dependent methyltransferase, YraL family [Helicobacter canadensis MIT 98-5491]STO99515.1 putative rRNA small subunit methyltransferase I [Helicobacter canadensis]
MVTFLPTPIGNLQDISFHTLEVLERCEVLLCEDTRVTKKLLSLLIERRFLKNKIYQYIPFHTHNQSEFLKQVSLDFFSQDIAFLSDAGMPCISDPGVELVRFLQTNALEYEVVGGISALTLAVAFSGIVEKEFTFLGFPPHKKKERLENFVENFKSAYPLVYYESPHRLLETLEMMCEVDSQRVVFVAKELTKKYQQTYKGTLQEVLEQLQKTSIKGEWVVVLENKKETEKEKTLTQEMIYLLDIPPKIKAKILSKLNNKPASEYYDLLCQK